MIFGKNPLLWLFPIGEPILDGLNWKSKLKVDYRVLNNNNDNKDKSN